MEALNKYEQFRLNTSIKQSFRARAGFLPAASQNKELASRLY
jgi:hypothetical protein